MKILKDLRAKLAAEQEKVKALLGEIEARTGGAVPTEDDDSKLDALYASIVATQAQIEKHEARKDVLTAAALATSEPSADTRAAAAPGTAGAAPINVTVVDKEKPVFRNLGEQLAAVVNAHPDNPSDVDPRVKERSINKLTEMTKRARIADAEFRAPAGLSTLVDTDGGYLLQPDIAAGIFKMALEQGDIASRCSKTEISQGAQSLRMTMVDENSRADGTRYGGVRAYWVNEADVFTPSKPKLKIWQVNLNKIIALGYATSEELADADAMSMLMTENFVKETAFQLNNAIFWGTGSSQPQGIFNSATLSLITQAKDSGQLANTLSALNLLNMRNQLLSGSEKNAVWFINRELLALLPQIALTTGSASGTLVYMPAGGLTGSMYDTLFGMPVITTEFNSGLTTKGDILLADLSYYKLITKGGSQPDQSIHVNFTSDEVVFRLKTRVGGKPMVEKPITPFKGTQTHSPFVTLATR